MKSVSLPAKVYLSFLLAAALLGLTAHFYAQSNRHYAEAVRRVAQTQRVLTQLETVLSLAKDAQTGQRGYVITHQEPFLKPYYAARGQLLRELTVLEELARTEAFHAPYLFRFRGLVQEQFVYLNYTIGLVRQGRPEAAAGQVAHGDGRDLLDAMRELVAAMQGHERARLAGLLQQVQAEARRNGNVNLVGLSVLIGLFALAAVVITADFNRQRQLEQQLQGLNRHLQQTNHDLSGTLAELSVANHQVRQYSATLELQNKDLESFSYLVSHDLKAPLRTALSFASILAHEYASVLDAEGHRLLGVVLSSGRTMNELIEALLRFSRLGRAAVHPAAVDMDALVAPLLAAATTEWPQELALEVGALGQGWADGPLIRQVWANLLGNAVKFAAGRPVLRLRLAHERRGAEDVYCVADNGAGFPPRAAQELFDMFRRLHAAADFPGTGVGLAICQRIVANHGGRIWAESEEGCGATFYFALPAGVGVGD